MGSAAAPRRVTFHVGLPKTATTTIQQYLRGQDERLLSHGVLYPGPRQHPAMRSHKHPLMLNAMMGKEMVPADGLDPAACREAVARVFDAFWASDLETLIWSCEGMALAARNWDADYLKQILNGAQVRFVLFARYIDDWVESLVKERIRGRSGSLAGKHAAKPLRLAPAPSLAVGTTRRQGGSLLARGAMISPALRTLRAMFPSGEIVVRSFDAHREQGTVVSGALEAMGVRIAGAFAGADDEAGVHNPTKSDLNSMLLYHLVTAEAGVEVIRHVAAATRKRAAEGREFEPLSGRRFRFLSDENIELACGYYEALRQDYPDLPAQPPYVPRPAERRLPKDEGVALLDWLRPDISDAIFDKACAAYPADLGS